MAGAGPAGLFLTLQLARYGLDSESLMCIDSKKEHTKTGHADGINARTLEILRTFRLEGEVLRDGTAFSELAFWGQSPKDPAILEPKMLNSFFNIQRAMISLGHYTRDALRGFSRPISIGITVEGLITPLP